MSSRGDIRRRLERCAHTLVVAVAAATSLASCQADCPSGTVQRGKYCISQKDGGVDDGGITAGTGGSGGDSGLPSGQGGRNVSGSSAGSAGNTGTPVDATTQWMCMKNGTGDCTSCKQDSDCPKNVCEQGFCMECRQTSQCGADETCILNRCVPMRKPSSIWTTSGGGVTSAAGFKLQISVGTPAPAGTAAVSGYKISVAPGAGLY